jgi:hypothetical protein
MLNDNGFKFLDFIYIPEVETNRRDAINSNYEKRIRC